MAVQLDTPQIGALRDAMIEADIDEMRQKARLPREETISGGEADEDIRSDGGMVKTVVNETRGTIRLWNSKTGEPSDLLISQLPDQLRKRFPDGTRVFVDDPSKAGLQVRGTIKCHLHPEHENREIYDRIGLAGRYCAPPDSGGVHVSNFRSEFDLLLHMQRKHKSEWAQIQANEDRIARERAEELQRETLRAMQALAAQNAPRRRRGEEDGAA